jgi:hypothetical protein
MQGKALMTIATVIDDQRLIIVAPATLNVIRAGSALTGANPVSELFSLWFKFAIL